MGTRILLLAGSPVDELLADVSRLYAAGALAVLGATERYEVTLGYVLPGGDWCFPVDLSAPAVAAASPVPLAEAVARIGAMDLDAMVPEMFCLPGMTHYRALFDLLGVPYPGNDPATMAVGADKALARAVVAGAGVRVPAAHLATPGTPLSLPLPVVVKPVSSDNSLGVTLVRQPEEYDAAVLRACEHADRALVETYVNLGREVRCGVVDLDGELVCLPLEEYAVDAVTKPIRDHDDKLRRSGSGDLGLVAKDADHAWIVDPSDPLTGRVHEAARRCYDALGCRQYGLFDFRVDPDGAPWFLEAGLYCSYAPTSVIVVMAEAAGIPLDRLFAAHLRAATRRTPVPAVVAAPSLSRPPAS